MRLTKGDLIIADRVLFPNLKGKWSGAKIAQYQKDAKVAQELGLIEWDTEQYVPTQRYIDLMDALSSEGE